jgi:hypothetical protein
MDRKMGLVKRGLEPTAPGHDPEQAASLKNGLTTEPAVRAVGSGEKALCCHS